MYSVLASAINHPDANNPYRALFNHRIIESLSRTDVSVDVVSPRPFAPPIGPFSSYASIPDTEPWGSYTVHHPRFWYLLPKRLLYALSGDSYARRVPRYAERTFVPADVVHACHIFPDGYGMLPYVRDHDIPLFVVGHGTLLNDFDDQPPGVSDRIEETLAEATGVLCVSDALAEKARSIVDTETVSTVPIGADPGAFPVDDRWQLREESGIAPDETVVLFVGEFSERKGIPEILEVLSTVDARDVVFVFVGHSGSFETDLRRALENRPDSVSDVFTGVSNRELRRWYAMADLLWLPSHSEGRPTVIYEAMASETAVLSTRIGGVAEQVVDGETGILVPPGDVDALRTALETLTGDRDRLRRYGATGLERLQERNWTWDGHARRVRTLHRAAIE